MTNAGYTLGGVHPALSFMGKRKTKRELLLLCPTLGNDLALRFAPFPSLGWIPFHTLDSKKNQVLHLPPAASAKALAEVSTSGKGDQ